jgi:hypothetical protein
MKNLDVQFQPPFEEIKSRISDMVSCLDVRDFDREFWRRKVSQEYPIRNIHIGTPGRTGFICADSSVSLQNIRYHAMWSIHCISLYGLFNGRDNEDPLVGYGSIPYEGLLYESSVDVGLFNQYWMVDQQMNYLRIAREYASIVRDYSSSIGLGLPVDVALVDGSLSTNLENLSFKADFPSRQAALDAQEQLLALPKVVSMAEDSHASDIARRLGLEMSNLMLFNLVLEEGEYVVAEGRFNVCYVNLPGKNLSYLGGRSSPLTVRWEFSHPSFGEDLDKLVSIWLKEDDLLHSQLYPLRIADYLTRKIRINGLLDEVIADAHPELEFRDLRES